MTPYIVAWLPYLTLGAVVLICSAVVVWLEIEAAGERMAHQAKCNHLDRLRREREAMEPMNYGKGKPRKLTRFREAMTGLWVLRCGHMPHHWNWEHLRCEKCAERKSEFRKQHDLGGEG